MFGSSSVYSNQKSKPNRNFQFLKINNQTKPNQNRTEIFTTVQSVSADFFISSVLCTPLAAMEKKKKKTDEIGGSRKLGIGPVLTVGVERRNDRGKEQELREKK